MDVLRTSHALPFGYLEVPVEQFRRPFQWQGHLSQLEHTKYQQRARSVCSVLARRAPVRVVAQTQTAPRAPFPDRVLVGRVSFRRRVLTSTRTEALRIRPWIPGVRVMVSGLEIELRQFKLPPTTHQGYADAREIAAALKTPAWSE